MGQAGGGHQGQRQGLQHGHDRKSLQYGQRRPQGRLPPQRGAVYLPPAGRGPPRAGPRHGHREHRRRPAARRGGGYPHHAGRPDRRLRRGSGPAGGRRHQADEDPVLEHRGAAGREPAQDAAGHEPGRPRHDHQALRPSPQYAHRRCMAGAEAPRQGPGDHGGLCPHCQPAGHPERQGGAGRPQPPLPRPRGLRGDQQDAQRARRGRVPRQRVGRHQEPPRGERHRGRHHQAESQEHLRHLPQDHHAEQVLRRNL